MNISRREFFAASAVAAICPKIPAIEAAQTPMGIPFWIVDSSGRNWEGYHSDPRVENLVWFTRNRDTEIAGSPHCIDWIVVG